MVPMNFLPADGSADYILTGSWGKKALKEAKNARRSERRRDDGRRRLYARAVDRTS